MNWAEITLIVLCCIKLVAYAILDGKEYKNKFHFSGGLISFLVMMWLYWCAGVIHS